MSFTKKYNLKMVIALTLLPLIGFIGTAFYIFYNGIVWQEPLLLLFFWFFSGLGITMGYHRLFAHKSYATIPFIEWILMILGSLALENTILKWASDHRQHHDKAETEDDPYSIKEGFWHAHIGWILKNTPKEKSKIRGVRDLQNKSAIRFQNKYYFYIAIILGFIIPFIIGLSYNRPIGALLWAGFLRITLVHHATFFINSLCHYFGKRTYDFNSTARDSWFVSLFTFGEGYHNYHHKFPSDFRNGIKWFAFDPSKWIISILSLFGITSNLIRTKDYFVCQSRYESIRSTILSKFKQDDPNCGQIYKDSIKVLFSSAENILSSWKNLDPTLLYNKRIKLYRYKINQVCKDLNRISRKISIST